MIDTTPYFDNGTVRLFNTDARAIPLPDESVDCVVTSPPYWGLRSYAGLGDHQLGLETTPELFVEHLVEIFREVWRVLKPTGTCWINLGDSYYGGQPHKAGETNPGKEYYTKDVGAFGTVDKSQPHAVLKAKDLVGIPWRTAFALQADGWWLRSDIIWSKKNPMPESVTDRPTKSHEYLFLLTKAVTYYYDQEAVREPAQDWGTRDRSRWAGTSEEYRQTSGDIHRGNFEDGNFAQRGRNRRSVWEIPTEPFSAGALSGGRPGIVSPDCLIHGDSDLAKQGRRQAARDAQRDHQAKYILGSDDRAATLEAGYASTTSRNSDEDYHDGTQPPQSPGNIGENRRPAGPHDAGHSAAAGPPSRNESMEPESNGISAAEPAGSGVAAAKGRNRSSCKSGDGSMPDDIAYVEPVGRTERTELEDGEIEQDGYSIPGTIQTAVDSRGMKCSCPIIDHFATFPQALVEPCIKAGTSEYGNCSRCGTPWVRVVEQTGHVNGREPSHQPGNSPTKTDSTGWAPTTRATDTWNPACSCKAPVGLVPSVVLDPFAGSGTVGVVAQKLGRQAVLVEMSAEYCELAVKRLSGVPLPLMAMAEAAPA